MKSILALTFILVLIGCAKAPNPASVSAIKKELKSPEEFNSPSLEIKREYQTGTEIFNFWLWPEVSRVGKVEVAARVAQLGLQIEEVYKRIDSISFKKAKIEKEITAIEKDRDVKLSVIFGEYKCFTETEDDEVCSESNEGIERIPSECFDLEFEPWNSEEMAAACEEKSEPIVESFEEVREKIEERIAPLEEIIDEELKIVTNRADLIIATLENGEKESEKRQNWFATEVSNIRFIKGEKNPRISLKIQFNNVEAGERNRFLRYKSSDNNLVKDQLRGITDVERILVGPIPTLKFTIHEKRALRNRKEELTGIKYKVTLRQADLDHGLDLTGDLEKIDSEGRVMAQGMMKIYLKRKY